MNKARRKLIEKAAKLLSKARYEELKARDNLPNGVYDGEQGDKMDHNVYSLDDALERIAEIDGVNMPQSPYPRLEN